MSLTAEYRRILGRWKELQHESICKNHWLYPHIWNVPPGSHCGQYFQATILNSSPVFTGISTKFFSKRENYFCHKNHRHLSWYKLVSVSPKISLSIHFITHCPTLMAYLMTSILYPFSSSFHNNYWQWNAAHCDHCEESCTFHSSGWERSRGRDLRSHQSNTNQHLYMCAPWEGVCS